jgi:hypothetical protein
LINLSPGFTLVRSFNQLSPLARRSQLSHLIKAVNTRRTTSRGLGLGSPVELDLFNVKVVEFALKRHTPLLTLSDVPSTGSD